LQDLKIDCIYFTLFQNFEKESSPSSCLSEVPHRALLWCVEGRVGVESLPFPPDLPFSNKKIDSPLTPLLVKEGDFPRLSPNLRLRPGLRWTTDGQALSWQKRGIKNNHD